MRTRSWMLLSFVVVLGNGAICVGEMIPFVIPAETQPGSVIVWPESKAITVNGPRLAIGQAHVNQVPPPGDTAPEPDTRHKVPITGFFQVENRRVRLWGVNLSFGANFPTHADAPRVAARLADAGVNTVRCHHMDTAPWPRGLWDPQDPKHLFPEALDRLDFFIHALAQEGIWVNLNLHVGHTHSRTLGLPKAPRKYDKIVNLFTPALIEAQKDFARKLLHHRNPYRKVTYADDPAVAIVEITNENSFFMWDAEETLLNLPPYYADILRDQYNQWLLKRYRTRAALKKAWSQGIETLGDNLIRNPSLAMLDSASLPEDWRLEQHGSARARLSRISTTPHPKALRVDNINTDQIGWHLQINQAGLRVEAGRYYTVRVEILSDAPRSVQCSIGQAHSPWSNLGLSRSLNLNTQWQTVSLGFVASADEDNARVSISFGESDTPFTLGRIFFQPGGQVGLLEKESLADRTVELHQNRESPARIQDRHVFLAETEKRYFDQMYRIIKKDLDCTALVTGTIVFGPLGLYAQSDMDFIDAHAYWQHPRFPGIPWDRGNWTINQKPMCAFPQEATLFALASKRLAGKPFTVSEYNHPAPMDSQAECVPLLASFAAAQDWDGLWFYTYSHSGDDWDRKHLNSFFDIDTNPAKWGFMQAGGAIFRNGAFGRLTTYASVPLSANPAPLPDRWAKPHQDHDGNMWDALKSHYGMGRSNLLVTQLAATREAKTSLYPFLGTVPNILWVAEDGQGFYGGEGPGAIVLAGHREFFNRAAGDQAQVTSPAFAVITLTTLDGQDLEKSKRLLVCACGRCENTDMVFSANRRTVGRQWGRAPVQIETVTGTLVLPKGSWQARGLGPNGVPRQSVSIRNKNGSPYLELAAQHKTMWYLVTRE